MEISEEPQQANPSPVRRPLGGLWQNADFVRLWVGTTVSLGGSQVTALALPLAAALTLGATPAQMGLLGAAETVPWVLMGLLAGVWVDRLPRRPILIAADLGRAALLALIPLAALAGLLRLEVLYGVSFLAGILTVGFDVAAPAFLPTLVGRAHLVEGNSKLLASASVADIAGPGLAGALVQAITAPLAILADVGSFLISAACLAAIRTAEPPLPRAQRHLGRELGEGLRYVAHDELLRPLTLCAFCANLGLAVHLAARILYLTRDLAIGPALLGVIFAAGSAGALPATVLVGRVTRRYGVGPTMLGALVVVAAGMLLFPLATGAEAGAVALLIGAQTLSGLGGLAFVITAGSLRQAITPPRLLGRVVATGRFVSRSALPLGLLLGGALGEQIGLRATLFVAAGVSLLPLLLALSAPFRTLHEMPPVRGE